MRNVTELSKLNGKVYVYLKDEVIANNDDVKSEVGGEKVIGNTMWSNWLHGEKNQK